MLSYPFRQPVTSEEEVRAIAGTPSEMAVKKQLAALDEHARGFIARSPFVLVGTAGANGDADVSPRGDGPGFVLVLDERTLVIPDRPGNRRVDTFRNVIANPHVGLLFLIPGVEETLRVNGRALLVRDDDLLARMVVQGKRPTLALAVEVDEVFFHCAKAFKRSRLWQPESWPERTSLPTLGKILLDQVKPNGATAAELDERLDEAYAKTLY